MMNLLQQMIDRMRVINLTTGECFKPYLLVKPVKGKPNTFTIKERLPNRIHQGPDDDPGSVYLTGGR